MTGPDHLAPPRATFTIRAALPSEIAVMNDIDDDATRLYAEVGVLIELAPDNVFALGELARWQRSAELGRAFLAVDEDGLGVGFAALDLLDGEPYLDQLAVRRSAMRRGIGSALLARSADWARTVGGSSLWLTTYAHVTFNRPYYERHGYVAMPESACSAGVRHHLRDQQLHLPAPERRVAMRLELRRAL